MAFDTSRQVYATEAAGWQRGLYDDVRATFRAPVVNWIFRTLVANDPELTRYLWAQLKPSFQTRAFGEATVAYRRAMLDAVGDDVAHHGPVDLSLSPAEWRELRGQLRTFDTVVPRLALCFEVVYRSLTGRDVGTDPETEAAATAPLPEWVDGERGVEPTMAAFDDADPAVADTVASMRSFHGFEEGLPSVYRCLVQWPTAATRLWDDVEPALTSAAFETACERGREVTASYAASVAYPPRLSRADVEQRFDADTAAALVDLFEQFARGPVETVLPAVPVFAAAVGASGPTGR